MERGQLRWEERVVEEGGRTELVCRLLDVEDCDLDIPRREQVNEDLAEAIGAAGYQDGFLTPVELDATPVVHCALVEGATDQPRDAEIET